MGLKNTSGRQRITEKGTAWNVINPEILQPLPDFLSNFSAKAVRFDNVVAIKLSGIHLFYLQILILLFAVM